MSDHFGLLWRGLVFVALLALLHRCAAAATIALTIIDDGGTSCRGAGLVYDAQLRITLTGTCDGIVDANRPTPAPPLVQVIAPAAGFACALTIDATAYGSNGVLYAIASHCGRADNLFTGSFDR